MDPNPFKLNNLLKNQSTMERFVINLNEDSSSEESDNENEQMKEIKNLTESTDLIQINSEVNLNQFDLNQDNLSEPEINQIRIPKKEEPDRNVAYKISPSTIKTMMDKKRNVLSLKIKLQETDQQSNRLKKLINKKNLSVQQMKSKIVQNRLKLRKQQAQVKKLYNSYLNASKEMKQNLKDTSTLEESLSVIQKKVENDKKLITSLETKSKEIQNLIDISLKELNSEKENLTDSASLTYSDNLKNSNNSANLTNSNNLTFDLNNLINNQKNELTANTPSPNQEKLVDLDDDNMSLASSDEQQLDLILEHNDTSINKRETLKPSCSKEPDLILLDQAINNQIKINSGQFREEKFAKPIPNIITVAKNDQIPLIQKIESTQTFKATSNYILDENSISKLIDKRLDLTRKTSSINKIPTKITNRRIQLGGIQTNTIQKKKPMDKKKNALLKKILMIEERNEKEEIERTKKEELNKIKMLNEKKEKDINELKQKLKSKQILSNAIIGLKKDIRNFLKLNDKIENYDIFVNGLSLFLENSLDKSYLLENLSIQIDNKYFKEFLEEDLKKSKSTSDLKDLNFSIHSNNLIQTTSQLEEIHFDQGSSVLESIRAYRLSNNFEERYIKKNGQDFTLIVDPFFANKINPYSTACNFDLNGKCNDDTCCSQHKKDFLLDQRQKVIDLLLYNPSITRYKGKVETKEDMNGLLKHLNEFLDNLEKKYTYNEMIKYLVKLIRVSEDEESIIIKTKVQMQQTESTSINEFISLQQQANQGENTFPEFVYNFKIRDRENVLTYFKLYNSIKRQDQLIAEDFENKYQQRFFNFNTIDMNLEEYCKENPSDIKNWIKLAFLQINTIHCNRSLKKQQLQNAIKIINTALDKNRLSLDLWKTYLYLLMNLLNNQQTEESFAKIEKQLQFICKKIIEHYPSYEIWKFYLSFCLNYLNKELISSEILDEIQSNNILYYGINNNRNKELISNAYLEMILYKVNLYIEINKTERAKTYLARILSSNIESISSSKASEFIKLIFSKKQSFEVDRRKYQDTALLTNEDKVFLWLNYLYLIHFNKLPSEKFELFKQGFSSLIDKKPFLITFNNSIKKVNLEKLLGILVESIKDCFFNIESNLMDYHEQTQEQIKSQMKQQLLITCLPLFHNLANLFYTANKKKTAIFVFNSMATEENQILVPLLINKAIFEEKNDYNHESFYTLGDTQVYKQDNFDIIYYLCLLHFKHGEYKFFNFEASKILDFFFDFDRSVPISVSFKKLLYRKTILDNEKSKLLEKVDSKLWTIYLMSEILSASEENMDSVLANSISLSKLNKNAKTHTINLLHFLFLNFYAKTITDQEKLNEFLQKLQCACLFIEDHQFQFYLLKHFSNCFFSLQQRFKFFLKFLILIPENKYILNHFLNLAFNEMNSKKICYQVLKYFIERNELRNLLEPVHWYIIIYLAIDFKEHLNLHYYFQLAISNYPYNKQLWHYILAWEVSQNHNEHIAKLKSILKQLKIPDLEKSLSFD